MILSVDAPPKSTSPSAGSAVAVGFLRLLSRHFSPSSLTRLKTSGDLGAHLTRVVVTSLVLAAGACNAAGEEETLRLPTRANFKSVGAAIEGNCGSLDCHGDHARNFRVYGRDGLRLVDVPGGATDTSDQELDLTFYSLVALEPEALAEVVSSGGSNAEKLLLIRKARGSVHHKGGTALLPASAGDRCLISWFTGTVDETACKDGQFPKPPDWP